MKHCHNCNKDLPKTDFGNNKVKPDGLQSQCKKCRRISNNANYANSPTRRATIKRNNALHMQKVNDYVKEYKLLNPCTVCGESEPCTLDFHHTAQDKEFDIGRRSRASLLRVKEEIGKCVVVCSNCHRKVHAGVITL